MSAGILRRGVNAARALDTRIARRSGQRRVLVDARQPVNFTMVAPVYRVMRADPRLEFWFTASEEPAQLAQIYREAEGVRLVHPGRAALMKFDAYVASDFMWASLPRGTCRIQVFHGVAGKYGFDAPDRSMRDWDRLFFVNQRRLGNFIASGAIDPDSSAIRLVGMPKTDCLVDGSIQRDAVLESLALDSSRPTVLYAPTWSPASSLNALGVDLVRGLLDRPINLIVKLHERSLDQRAFYSGGIDWPGTLRPILSGRQGVIAPRHDVSPYLIAADLMITDHSSAGFEFLLCNRPIVRIHRPELLTAAQVHPDYAALLASVSESVTTVGEALAAVDRSLANPSMRSDERRAVAADLFYRPGGATGRAIQYLYEALSLSPIAALASRQEAGSQPSA